MGDNQVMPTDALLVSAVDVARDAANETADAGTVGEHLRSVEEGDGLVAHHFASTQSGYRGWYWSVTITRAPDEEKVTVNEVVLLPGRRGDRRAGLDAVQGAHQARRPRSRRRSPA